jgi:hypothetical protein
MLMVLMVDGCCQFDGIKSGDRDKCLHFVKTSFGSPLLPKTLAVKLVHALLPRQLCQRFKKKINLLDLWSPSPLFLFNCAPSLYLVYANVPYDRSTITALTSLTSLVPQHHHCQQVSPLCINNATSTNKNAITP